MSEKAVSAQAHLLRLRPAAPTLQCEGSHLSRTRPSHLKTHGSRILTLPHQLLSLVFLRVFFLVFFICVYLSVSLLCVYGYPQRPEEGTRFSWSWSYRDCKHPAGCWEATSDSLGNQEMILTAEPFLKSIFFGILRQGLAM